MRLSALLVSLAAALSLGACVDSPGNRAIGGAVAGAVIADATGGSAVTGAVIGGLGGAASCTIPGQLGC